MKSGFYYYNVGKAQDSMPSFETFLSRLRKGRGYRFSLTGLYSTDL